MPVPQSKETILLEEMGLSFDDTNITELFDNKYIDYTLPYGWGLDGHVYLDSVNYKCIDNDGYVRFEIKGNTQNHPCLIEYKGVYVVVPEPYKFTC